MESKDEGNLKNGLVMHVEHQEYSVVWKWVLNLGFRRSLGKFLVNIWKKNYFWKIKWNTETKNQDSIKFLLIRRDNENYLCEHEQ